MKIFDTSEQARKCAARTLGAGYRFTDDGWVVETPDDVNPNACVDCGHDVEEHNGTGPCPLDSCESFRLAGE